MVFDPYGWALGAQAGGAHVEAVLFLAQLPRGVLVTAQKHADSRQVVGPGILGTGRIAEAGVAGIELVEALLIPLYFAREAKPFGKHAAVLEDLVAEPIVPGEPFKVAPREGLAFAGEVVEGTGLHCFLDLRFDELFEAHGEIVQVLSSEFWKSIRTAHVSARSDLDSSTGRPFRHSLGVASGP